MILADFVDEADAFENVGDVVNSSFLYIEVQHGLIQVKCLLRCVLKQVNELLGQLDKTILFAALAFVITHINPIVHILCPVWINPLRATNVIVRCLFDLLGIV
jgi:hypothetical protein